MDAITRRGSGLGSKSENRAVLAQFRMHCWKQTVGVGGVWEMQWLCWWERPFDNVCAARHLSHKPEMELPWLGFGLSVSNNSGG